MDDATRLHLIRPSGFGFLSAFELRISDFLPAYSFSHLRPLAFSVLLPKLPDMKLLWATLLHLAVAVVLGAGILLLMQGKPALLIGSTVVYFVLLAKVGCASH
jgi:hypothetical protein